MAKGSSLKMIEKIGEMLERHKREIGELQINCPHKNKQVHRYISGPLAHGGSYQDFCEDCGKVLAFYKTPMKMVEISPGLFDWEYGKEERVENG